MKILLSWSSGKDSAWALHLLNQQHPGAVRALLTTINERYDRVAMHGVRVALLRAQAEAAGLPLWEVPLPDQCVNEVYEARMREACARASAEGFTHVAFGDLFLENIRRYRVDRLEGTGLTPLFPVWQIPTRQLAEEMIAAGLRARLSVVDTRVLDASFAGRDFDASLLADLPPSVDPCGENGEFHSCVYAGPMFRAPIDVQIGERIDRPPFAFIDIEMGSGVTTKSKMTPDPKFPRRIVCLTEETTETLYLLGEGDRVVGVSGYTVRPPEARSKPRVSAFINARFEKIEALNPDLILAFSDLQADIATELIKRGHTVVTFNQRSVAEILQMIRMLGGLIGCGDRAHALAAQLEQGLDEIRASAARLPRRPRVFFEEWDDPLISGIEWVEELVEIAGGDPIYPELRHAKLGKDRIVSLDETARRDPEIIIGSWCGKAVRTEKIAARPGWGAVTAVRHGHVYEVKSALILQPGPAALTDGVRQVHEIMQRATSTS